MITGEHTHIRFPELDDAFFVRQLYVAGPKRAALLDSRREPILPTTPEIQKTLLRKGAAQGLMYSVEDTTGALCGWCGLRGINYEAQYAELVLLFVDAAAYDTAADEVLTFLLGQAFTRFRLYKVLVLSLDTEHALMHCLERHGFAFAGAQRRALFTGGDWRDLRTYTLKATDYQATRTSTT